MAKRTQRISKMTHLENDSPIGKVYLVGAGPGDPGLLTIKALNCFKQADVALYDYLVNPVVLEYIDQSVETICLGRHGHSRLWTQQEINARMVSLAKAGKTVVRLKGGDPAIFARGAEEVEVLIGEGIPFEIVPGITTALAAGSYAGIPVTHYEMASAVALVTGQERLSKKEQSLNYAALAKFPGTLVFYMGVTTAPTWTAELISAGKDPQTPSAIIRRCSLPDQLTVHCTLAEVADAFGGEEKIRPPAIVVIGEVTQLAAKFSWFEKSPLFGVKILVTRPKDQVAPLRETLRSLGADVLVQEAIRISDPPNWEPVDKSLEKIDQYDWLVFSSANGVRYFFDRLEQSGRDMRCLGSVKISAIGPRTAEELKRYRLNVDLLPQEYRAEALVAALTDQASGKRFLLVRASRGREVLAEQLSAAGAQVQQVVAYTSSDVLQLDPNIEDQLAAGKIDWIIVTSSAIARSLVTLLGERLKKSRLASISPITSETLRELGFSPATEASTYTTDGVVEAILKDCQASHQEE